MTKRFIYSLALIVVSFQCLTAQSNSQAEKIVSDLLASAKSSAIKTNFKLIAGDSKNVQTITGTFTLKDSKFMLEIEGMKVWFDGKTQWAFNQQSNEVTITEPTEKELSETNPMAILSGFKSKCKIIFSSKTKSTINHCIEMTPKTKSKDIIRIELQVNKATGNIVSIKLINNNGNNSMLSLDNFQKGLKVPDNTFIFSSTKYKGVSINDLR
jgi:outer membrane lipoprotein-sorting protein